MRKKLLLCLLALVLCVALCACGGSEKPVQEELQEGDSHLSAVTGTEADCPFRFTTS